MIAGEDAVVIDMAMIATDVREDEDSTTLSQGYFQEPQKSHSHIRSNNGKNKLKLNSAVPLPP